MGFLLASANKYGGKISLLNMTKGLKLKGRLMERWYSFTMYVKENSSSCGPPLKELRLQKDVF